MAKKFTVILKRIIAVNSAKFAYAEIPLDDNLVIFGSGNLGKTSIVNAVRFFLLPELNVKNSDFKFGFVSGKGESTPYFTKDQIYDHYFPTDDSRLILEVEHLLIGGGKQVHCQIIFKGGDYGLRRCFIPEPYSEIEHLFWDKDKNEAGARPKLLPGQKLLAELNKINPNTKQYGQYEQLTQALYTAEILKAEECPFVIFPLKDTKPSSIDSLRALVKMLFNQDEKSLRLMTATAIELRDQDDNVLALDIDSIISEQADLRRRREQLELFRSHEPKFRELKSQFGTLTQQGDTEAAFSTLYTNLQGLSDRQNSEMHELALSVAKARTEQKGAEDNSIKNKQECSYEERRIADLNKKINAYTDKLNKADVLLSSYAGMSEKEIEEILQEEMKDSQVQVEAFEHDDKKRQLLERFRQELGKNEVELRNLIERQEKGEFSLLRQLDQHTISTLAAINKELANANPKRKLSAVEIEALQRFSSLFKVSGNTISFFDTSFAYITNFTTNDPITRIEDLTAEIKDLKRKISELSEAGKDDRFSVAKKIEALNKQIRAIEADLILIGELDHTRRSLTDYKAELVIHQESLAELSIKSETLEHELHFYNERFNELKSHQDRLQASQRALSTLLSRFNLVERYPSLSAKLNEVTPDLSFSFTSQCENNLLQLSKSLEEISRAKEKVKQGLVEMVYLRLIDDEFGLLEGNNSDSAIQSMFGSLSHKYALLNEDSKVLEQAVKTHNEHFRNRLERLNKTRDRIGLFVKQINDELSEAKVNDLEAVRLTVMLHPFFEDLVNSWREYDDLGSDGTLPEEWYSRLRTFLESDAVNQSDKILRMENVIKFAGYETKKLNEPWDSKAQSNSTKMLINTHLCEIFIRQLSDDENASVQFPVIMDEIGSVSSEQFPTLIEDLNSRGRKLIGVTVHGKSGDVTVPFKNILIMDELLTSEPYSNQRRNVCFSRDVETVISKISEQAPLFGGDA